VLSRVLASGWLALPGAFVTLTLSLWPALMSGVEGGVHVGMAPARLGWALLPLLAAALLLRGRRESPRYATADVDRGDIVEVVGATGTLEAVTTVQIGSQVSGTINILHADFNSVVKKGQVIARLDPSLFEARLGQAKANLIAAQANVERARATVQDARLKYERAQELAAQRLVPQSELAPLGAPAAPKPAGKTSSFLPAVIAVAHAGEALAQSDASQPVRFGIGLEQPKYVVVLKQAASEQQAVQQAQRIRQELPSARAVKAAKGYFVILGDAPAGETDALLAATRAKKLLGAGVQPMLVEVRK